jgi:hypothetical protein
VAATTTAPSATPPSAAREGIATILARRGAALGRRGILDDGRTLRRCASCDFDVTPFAAADCASWRAERVIARTHLLCAQPNPSKTQRRAGIISRESNPAARFYSQERLIETVGDESGLPPTPDVLRRRSEPTLSAMCGRIHCNKERRRGRYLLNAKLM